MAPPQEVEQRSLTSLLSKLIKIVAKVVRHGRYVPFQVAEVAISRPLFAEILRLTDGLLPAPLPPLRASIQKHPGPPTEELRLVSVEVCSPLTSLAAQRPLRRKIGQQTEEIAMQCANQAPSRL